MGTHNFRRRLYVRWKSDILFYCIIFASIYATCKRVFWYYHSYVLQRSYAAAFSREYGEYEAIYEIDTLDITRGSLPRRAHALVLEWAALHRNELRHDWERARAEKPLVEIKGLE